jgi:hypothetical protein
MSRRIAMRHSNRPCRCKGSVVTDEEERSSDVVAGGTVAYRPPTATITQQVATARGIGALAVVYAADGQWYDAVDAISQAVARSPGDAALRAARASLLRQVGLDAAAQYDLAGDGLARP